MTAQRLTLEAIYGPGAVDFSGQPPTLVKWLDGERWLQKEDGQLVVVDRGGHRGPLFDPAALAAALERAGLDPHPEDVEIADGGRALLAQAGGQLVHVELEPLRVHGLGAGELAAFSPDRTKVAFVRGNDLYVADLTTSAERRLTHDGSENVLNGKLDWIYQEEIYGRGHFRSFWWSPDSRRLAFLRLDESRVPRFTIVDERTSQAEALPYPKPGDPNPEARLGIVDAAGGATTWVTTGAEDGGLLVVSVGWSPDARHLVAQVQDRTQTWLELRRVDPATGASKTVVREQSGAWVEPSPGPFFLRDGRFVWPSERTGFRHLYLMDRDGHEIKALTRGRFEVRSVHGIDEAHGLVYFSATERTPIAEDVYRVGLDGTGFRRLSAEDGFHEALFAPDFAHWLHTNSRLHVPPQVRLDTAEGSTVLVVHAARLTAVEQFGLRAPEHVQVRARDGVMLEGLLLRPEGCDATHRCPVYHHVYSSPRAPKVVDRWGVKSRDQLFFQLLAQRGIAVWLLDNRSASGKGVEAAWPVRGRMGELELQDIEDGLDWLVEKGFVDPQRIGIEGWSGGGFMTLYALTHSRRFAMGIAGGAVADWREYDSIWTERHMDVPKSNPDGYARTAPVARAAQLHGALLLVHGTADDNVHAENTLRMADALQQAGKPFRLMLYPGQRHTFTDPEAIRHLRTLMLDFVDQTLLDSARRP